MNKLNTLLKELKDEVNDLFSQQNDTIIVVLRGVGSDLNDFKNLTEEKAKELIDKILDDQKIYFSVHRFLKSAKNRKQSAVKCLEKEYENLHDHLDERVKEDPEIVGFLDGVFYIYLAIPAKRWARSRRYKKYVKYGMVVGGILSVTLFLPGFGVRGLIGIVPYATRIVKYFNSKIKSAHYEKV